MTTTTMKSSSHFRGGDSSSGRDVIRIPGVLLRFYCAYKGFKGDLLNINGLKLGYSTITKPKLCGETMYISLDLM
jgi:hypothetical protein